MSQNSEKPRPFKPREMSSMFSFCPTNYTSTTRAEDLLPNYFLPLVFSGNITGLYFAFCVVIDGVEYKTGMGITKKAARLKAAQLALPDLLPTLESLKSFLPEASG